MRIISLFSGAGGMDLGFLSAGYDVVYANDYDNNACESYYRNIGNIDCTDIMHVNVDNIPDGDVVIGGFPCQDFSVLGGSKRQGIKVERGRLFRSFVNIIKEKKPIAFVAENVKGILSANKGIAFSIMYKDFSNPSKTNFSESEIAYSVEELEDALMKSQSSNLPLFQESEKNEYKVFYSLINFADYGVPQFRERVIIIGIRSDIFIKQGIFAFPKPFYSDKNYISSGEVFEGKAIYFKKVNRIDNNNKIARTKSRTVRMLKAIPEGGNFKDLPDGLKVKGLMSNIYRKLDRKRPSPTVIANGGGGTWGYHYEEPRSLTNRERARLQTFPDDYLFFGNISQVRKQIGNAVPPIGILPIALKLKNYLIGSNLSNKDYEYLNFVKNLRNRRYRGFWKIRNIVNSFSNVNIWSAILSPIRKHILPNALLTGERKT